MIFQSLEKQLYSSATSGDCACHFIGIQRYITQTVQFTFLNLLPFPLNLLPERLNGLKIFLTSKSLFCYGFSPSLLAPHTSLLPRARRTGATTVSRSRVPENVKGVVRERPTLSQESTQLVLHEKSQNF